MFKNSPIKKLKLYIGLEHEPLTGVTHFLGAFMAVAALVLLIVFASTHGSPGDVVAFTIFGFSLLALYASSSLYHLMPIGHHWKRIMQRIDHSMIFILIAGTYTPLTIVTIGGTAGWVIFIGIWVLAASGIWIKASWIKVPPLLSTVIYIILGWLVFVPPLSFNQRLSTEAFTLLLLGGVSYTVGAIIFEIGRYIPNSKKVGYHEIFHVFTLFGSASHFLLMYKYLLPL